MPTIYRKTDKGRAEIGTRAHQLPLQLRSLLIMADGRRTVAQLAQLGPHAATGLSKLAAEGYLEALIERARGGTPTPASAEPAPAAPSGSVATRPEHGPAFLAWRQGVVRALTDAVGPLAESLALRMEATTTATAMQPLLLLAQQLLRDNKGAAAAQAFGDRFIDPAG